MGTLTPLTPSKNTGRNVTPGGEANVDPCPFCPFCVNWINRNATANFGKFNVDVDG